MTVIVYQCDVCNRTINKTLNKHGLTVMGRCVITDNCKGSLIKIDEKPDSVARGFPAPVSGLEDWRQRRLLYNHTQTIQSSKWKIKHDLDTQPSVQVFIDKVIDVNGLTELVEVEPTAINYLNGDEVEVVLDSAQTGFVQCIARTATVQRVTSTSTASAIDLSIATNVDRISTEQTITIATRSSKFPSIATPLDLDIVYLSSQDLSPISGVDPVSLTSVTPSSIWFGAQKIFVNGAFYDVRSGSINVNQLQELGIEDGVSFYFNQLDGASIQEDDAFVMLANAPYQDLADRNYNQLVDLTAATKATAAANFIYNQRELYVNNNTKQSIFPAITVAR